MTAKGAVLLAFLPDARGARQSGVQVELARRKTGFSHLAETAQTGRYVIVARLGDESAGEKPRLRAAGRTMTIVARFDPENHIRERGTRVDLGGGLPVETPTMFSATLERFLRQ